MADSVDDSLSPSTQHYLRSHAPPVPQAANQLQYQNEANDDGNDDESDHDAMDDDYHEEPDAFVQSDFGYQTQAQTHKLTTASGRPQRSAVAGQTTSKQQPSQSQQRSKYFSIEQTSAMETMYQRNRNPDREAMEILGHSIGLQYPQVRKWFSRRRSKKDKPADKPATAQVVIPVQVATAMVTRSQREASAGSEESIDSETPLSEVAPKVSAEPDPPIAGTELPQPPAAPQITLNDIDFADPASVTRFLKFLAAAEGIEEKLARIRLGDIIVSDAFYESLAQSKSFKGLILFRQWITEAKDAAASGNVSAMELLTEVLSLLEKLPIKLDGLVASKLGRVVKVLTGGGVGVNDEAKGRAQNLTTQWAALVQKPTSAEGTAGSSAEQQPQPITAADRLRMQREREEAIASAAAAKAESLLATLKRSRQADDAAVALSEVKDVDSKPNELPSSGLESKETSQALYPSFSYRKAKSSEPATSEIEKAKDTAEIIGAVREESPPVLNAAGLRSVLVIPSSYEENGVAAIRRKKKKSVMFAADLVKIRFFNPEDDASAAGGDKHFKNKSARESEKQEGRKAFRKDDRESKRIKISAEWRKPRMMKLSRYPLPKQTSEMQVQDAREKLIVSVTYYSDDDIPDTPAEPDWESSAVYGALTIPLDEPESSVPVPGFGLPGAGVFTGLNTGGLGNFNVLSGLSGLGNLLSQQQKPADTAAANASSGIQNLLMSLQKQQAQPVLAPQTAPDVSNLLKSLGVNSAANTAPAAQTLFSTPPVFQQSNQQAISSNLTAATVTPPIPQNIGALFNNASVKNSSTLAFLQNLKTATQQVPIANPNFAFQIPPPPPPSLGGSTGVSNGTGVVGGGVQMPAIMNVLPQSTQFNGSGKHPRPADDSSDLDIQRMKRIAEKEAVEAAQATAAAGEARTGQYGTGYAARVGGSARGRGGGGGGGSASGGFRREDVKPRGLCLYWREGNCQYGSRCFNIHEGPGGSVHGKQ
ncbi:hypothetical protein HDU82_004726 [Entophlyctis luteolus]|nr:hypothetical protein HDU82_004726 [Entophlyctis luteolus]